MPSARAKMVGPIAPDRKLPHAAARDIGAAAAGLLIDRSWSGREDVAVLGPEDLSYADLAAIVSDVIGREVRYEHQTYGAYKEAAIGRDMTDAFAQGFVDMLRAKEEGMDNVASRVTAIIEPTSFRQWAEKELKLAIGD